MKIFLITDVIHPGGAEIFVLQLAQALKRKGHHPFLFILKRERINKQIKDIYAPDVPVISPNISFVWIWSKIDAVLYRLKIKFSFLRRFYSSALTKYSKSKNIRILNSHLFTSDMVAIRAGRKNNIPVVSTLHGDYLLFTKNKRSLMNSRVLNFNSELHKVFDHVNSFVCITDEQKLQMETLQQQFHFDKPLYKIYNGYEMIDVPMIKREDLGINENAFVVGMVARGIKEKGWNELIEGFLKASIPGAHLVLVGGGLFLDELKLKYPLPFIHFIGAVSTPVSYIRLFDLACLPSYFESESLPTVIIEYLFCGKPVLATNKGEIPVMLRVGKDDACGLTINISSSEIMIDSLRAAINKLFSDKDLYNRLKENTQSAAKIFDMDTCAMAYEKVFEQNIRSTSHE